MLRKLHAAPGLPHRRPGDSFRAYFVPPFIRESPAHGPRSENRR